MGSQCCRGSTEPLPRLETIKIASTLEHQLSTDIRYGKVFDTSGIKFRTDEEVKTMYQIEKKVGQGLFSKVYCAKDSSGMRVALKVVSKKDHLEETLLRKILTEKELLIRFSHPNIIKLYRTIQSNTNIYMVLEYCDKGTLGDLAKLEIRFEIEIYRVIAAQVIEALSYLHSNGVVYGDLKPENVMINQQGVLKLGDFNLSATSSLLDNKIQGTISYIAPELLLQNYRSEKSDWWALGVLLHYLFYHRFPFKTRNQAEMIVNLFSSSIVEEPPDCRAPKEFRNFLLALLEKDPKKRIGDSVQQIKKHPFFNGFDWKRYMYDQSNFEYAQHLPSLCAEAGPLQSMLQEQPDKSNENSAQKYYYHIDNFTYDNEERDSKAKSFLVASKS